MASACVAIPKVTFPASERHRPLTGNKLYCLALKKNPPDRMLAIPWRRLFLTAFGLNLVVVAVLCDSRVIGCCPA